MASQMPAAKQVPTTVIEAAASDSENVTSHSRSCDRSVRPG